jgi:putative nucleotidyltransferase with HDIG domain
MEQKNGSKIKKGKKILVVEDEAFLSEMIKDFLEIDGFDVVICEDGKSAKHQMIFQQYDLILSDVNMPGGLGGIDILEYARTLDNYKETPFILMTGYSKLSLQRDSSVLGAKIIISKPFTNEELMNQIYSCFNLSQWNEPEKVEIPEFADDDFSKISIDNFMTGQQLKYDIFIKLKEDKYIKIAHKNENLDIQRLKIYQQKGLKFLYLKREDFRKYLGLNVELLKIVNNNTSLEKEKKLNILKHTSEIILEQLYTESVHPESLSVAKDILESSFDMILDTRDGMELAQAIKNGGDKNYAHHLAVSFYAIIIARGMGWSSLSTLFKVSMAGLLHDIGEREIPKELLDKSRGELTFAEIKILESHPEKSAQILANCPSVPSDVIQIVLQHHENCAGRGYPYRLRKSQINPLARLIAVADTFCELAFKDSGLSVIEALSRLNSLYSETLDQEYIHALNKAFKEQDLFFLKKSA